MKRKDRVYTVEVQEAGFVDELLNPTYRWARVKGAAGDADVPVDVVQRHSGPAELQIPGGGTYARAPSWSCRLVRMQPKIEAMPGVQVHGTVPATGKCSTKRGVPYSSFAEQDTGRWVLVESGTTIAGRSRHRPCCFRRKPADCWQYRQTPMASLSLRPLIPRH